MVQLLTMECAINQEWIKIVLEIFIYLYIYMPAITIPIEFESLTMSSIYLSDST